MKNTIVLHIPKTAGSTLRTFIDKSNCLSYEIASKDYVVPISNSFTNERKSINEYLTNENQIFIGHVVFDSRFIENFNLYTIVRDPVDHFISFLLWCYFETYKKHNKNINNLSCMKINYGFLLNMTEDDLTKIKTMIKNGDCVSNPFVKTIAGITYHKFFFDMNDQKIDEDIYLKAKNNLQFFKFIGHTKQYDLFLDRFIYDHELENIKIQNEKVMKYEQQYIRYLKDHLSDIIREYNSWDVKLLDDIL